MKAMMRVGGLEALQAKVPPCSQKASNGRGDQWTQQHACEQQATHLAATSLGGFAYSSYYSDTI